MPSDLDEVKPSDQRIPDGESADIQEGEENVAPSDAAVQPEQLDQDLSELLRSYPLVYIKHFVVGDVTGVVGDQGRFRAKEFTVLQPSRSIPPVSGGAPCLKDAASFEDWFFETSLDNQLHVLLVAVFAENSLRLANEARALLKKDLVARTAAAEEQVDSATALAPFRKSISSILEETRTCLFEVEYTVESGPTKETTVGFADPDVHKAALGFMRSSVDIEPLRSKLSDLLVRICVMRQVDLHSLGTSMINLTRSQAAVGLGELAKHDYAYYLSFIIRPWARSQDAFLRFLVGWILFALSTDETKRASVFSLLTHWAKSDNDYFKWTAAAACSRMGLIDIDGTLEIIEVLLATDSSHVLRALGVSLGLLSLSAQNAYRIVERFADWLQPAQDTDAYPILQDNIPPMFLSFVQGEFTDDVDLVDEREDDSAKGNDPSPNRMGIWHLVGREMSRGEYTLSRSISTLVKQGFVHNSARIVDWTCEIVEQWIGEGGEWEDSQSIMNSICQVLVPLRDDRIASRYIGRIINSRKFTNNPVAARLREAYAYDAGG